MGQAGIEPILRAIENDAGLEVQARGLEVLKRLARSDQPDIRNAAQQALESLASGTSRRVAERAARKLDELKDFRSGNCTGRTTAVGSRYSVRPAKRSCLSVVPSMNCSLSRSPINSKEPTLIFNNSDTYLICVS